MALMLAPYNDSMRLGMGFNSYTHTMCIDGAVEVKDEDTINAENPSQTVTYSAKYVEHLSDVVSSMNISYSSAIKKGTIEVSGNGNSIDEDKIKASDVNLIISVQVINQTTCIKDSAMFKHIEGVRPGSGAFNDAFGDCYISGFIEGGNFTSIVSMRCLDRSKASTVVQAIKKMAKSSEPKAFTLDSYALSSTLSSSDALKDTETTVSVSWMGGGQIKDSQATWDIDSVYAAAAAFPSNVAKRPQRTWAILTKYKANRSFNQWALALSLTPLEYDAVISYTAELFNNYMEYKQLLKTVQDIIQNRDDYIPKNRDNAIPTTISTLFAVRDAMRVEMNKIVAVVDVLSRRPELLKQADSFNISSKDALVRKIIDAAVSAAPASKVILDVPDTADTLPASAAAPGAAPATSSGDSDSGFQHIDHGDALTTPATDALPPVSQAAPAPVAPTQPATHHLADPKTGALKMDLSQLIAPEVWADLLPDQIVKKPVADTDAAAVAAAASMFPPPPKNDAVTNFIDQKSSLKILAAVCGIHDVTELLNLKIEDNDSLSIKVNEIDGLARSPAYADFPPAFVKNLSFIYQYGTGPMRFHSATHKGDSSEIIHITSKSDDAVVTGTTWDQVTWSIVAIVYGGKLFTDQAIVKRVEDQIRKDVGENQYGSRRATLDYAFFGEDPLPNVNKTSVIFYKSEANGMVRATVALDGSGPCALTACQQLSGLEKTTTKEIVKEVPKEVIKEVIKEVPKEVIKEVPHEVIKEVVKPGPGQIVLSNGLSSDRHSCSFDPDRFKVGPSQDPFLRFANGVTFQFHPDCSFAVYLANGTVQWTSHPQMVHNMGNVVPHGPSGPAGAIAIANAIKAEEARHQQARELHFQADGNLITYAVDGAAVWASNSTGKGARLVLSSTQPYIEIFKSDGTRVYNS